MFYIASLVKDIYSEIILLKEINIEMQHPSVNKKEKDASHH